MFSARRPGLQFWTMQSGGVVLVSGFQRADLEALQGAYPGSTLHGKNTWRLLEYLRDGNDSDVLRA